MKSVSKYYGLVAVVLFLYGTNLCYFFISSEILARVIGLGFYYLLPIPIWVWALFQKQNPLLGLGNWFEKSFEKKNVDFWTKVAIFCLGLIWAYTASLAYLLDIIELRESGPREVVAEVLSTHDNIRLKYNYAEINILNLAYKIFFYGLGKNSEMNYVPYLNQNEKYLFDIIKEPFKLLQLEYQTISTNANPERKYYTIKIKESKEEIDLFYYPFDGHINILGHYFRHLFQTVNFVISQDFLDSQEKYSYLKILRAQLSNFEQLMLYYNAIIWFDIEWREAFTEYRFIKKPDSYLQ